MTTGNLFAELEKEKRAKPRVHVVYNCAECGKPTNFQIVNQYCRYSSSEPTEEVTFAVCEECAAPAVFSREDFGDGFDEDSFLRLYPPHERFLGYLPDAVRVSYEEAVRCEESSAWHACAVMIGRTLEALCKEVNPNAKSIFGGLKDLHESGAISQDMLDWAHELRILRNIGAHASNKRASQLDAQEALDFLQAILEIMYDLRKKWQIFQELRKEPN